MGLGPAFAIATALYIRFNQYLQLCNSNNLQLSPGKIEFDLDLDI